MFRVFFCKDTEATFQKYAVGETVDKTKLRKILKELGTDINSNNAQKLIQIGTRFCRR